MYRRAYRRWFAGVFAFAFITAAFAQAEIDASLAANATGFLGAQEDMRAMLRSRCGHLVSHKRLPTTFDDDLVWMQRDFSPFLSKKLKLVAGDLRTRLPSESDSRVANLLGEWMKDEPNDRLACGVIYGTFDEQWRRAVSDWLKFSQGAQRLEESGWLGYRPSLPAKPVK
jgi:hypothetical protein